MTRHRITIHHSSDTDDLFMMYGFEKGGITIPGFDVTTAPGDIEALNQRAKEGELDVSAASVHAYAYLSANYAISTTGASFGGPSHGPRLVMKAGRSLPERPRIGLPGDLTSAALALKLYLAEKGIEAELQSYFFEDLPRLVIENEIDAGLLIHEGQLTHVHQGLETKVDLGKWWWDSYGEPLPLGIVIVNRKFGADGMQAIVQGMEESIRYALAHREQAIRYALSFGRGMTYEEADRYISMYVNDVTVNLGALGRRSIQRFLGLGREKGFVTVEPDIHFAA